MKLKQQALKELRFSVYDDLTSRVPRYNIDLANLYLLIANGSYSHVCNLETRTSFFKSVYNPTRFCYEPVDTAYWVSCLRNLTSHYSTCENKETLSHLKSDRNDIKRSVLPAFTVSGVFGGRDLTSHREWSGCYCLDFDDIVPVIYGDYLGSYYSDGSIEYDASRYDDYVDYISERICADNENVLLCFRSPSGTGLKVLLYDGCPVEQFSQRYGLHLIYFYERYGLSADVACTDVNRLTLVSYDSKCRVSSKIVSILS